MPSPEQPKIFDQENLPPLQTGGVFDQSALQAHLAAAGQQVEFQPMDSTERDEAFRTSAKAGMKPSADAELPLPRYDGAFSQHDVVTDPKKLITPRRLGATALAVAVVGLGVGVARNADDIGRALTTPDTTAQDAIINQQVQEKVGEDGLIHP